MDFLDSYLKPNRSNIRYKERDPEITKIESNRMLKIFSLVSKLSKDYCINHGIVPPRLEVKGSAAVGMADKSSDLDVAVFIKKGHDFMKYTSKWINYRNFIQSIAMLNKLEIHLLCIDEADAIDK